MLFYFPLTILKSEIINLIQMIFTSFLKRNKTISILLFVILSIISVGVIGNRIINNEIENWSETIDQKNNSIESGSIDYINTIQTELILEKDLLKNNLKKIDSLDFSEIQKQFINNHNTENIFAVFDSSNIIFWNSNFNQLIIKNDSFKISFGETYFLKSGIDTYLLIKDTISAKSPNQYLICGTIVEKQYELNSAYFKKISLTNELQLKFGVDFTINYSSQNLKNKDGRKYSFDVKNNNNNKIASVVFVKQTREKYVENLNANIFLIQSMLALLGYLLLGVVLYQKISAKQNLFSKFILYSLYFIALRYLLIFIKIPQGISSSGIFDSKVYYSDFGFGLTNSPIELFITLIILFLILFTAFRYTLIYYKASNKKSNFFKFYLLFIFSIVLYAVSLRGFSAASRSFVFDTSIRYFQDPSLNFDFPTLLMHINVLVLGICSILGSSTLILFLAKSYKLIFNKNIELFFIVFSIIYICGIIFYQFIQKNPQSTIFIQTTHVILVFILVFLLTKYELKNSTKILAIYFIASFASIITLLFYNSELEKESLKTTARVITRENDDFYRAIIFETLLDDFSRKIATEAFQNSKTNFNSYAFMIWSKSNLQKESINSSVNFLDLKGNLLGGFGSIYPQFTIKNIIDTNAVIEEIKIFEEKLDGDSHKIIRGIFPLKDEYAFLGYLDVSILSDLNDFGFSTHPEFISTGKLNDRAILKLNKLSILDYRNKQLKLVYGSLNPSAEVNDVILNTKLTDKNDAWFEKHYNDSEYIFYVKKVNLYGIERIVAVALKEKELSIGLFDFFKVFFTHSIILLFAALIYFSVYYERYKSYQLNLRDKLLIAFLIISLIPLLFIAFYFREITENNNEETTYYNLGRRAFSIETYLNNHNDNSKLNFANASYDLNINYSVFSKNQIEYSTDDLIYDVGILPKLLNPIVYQKLFVDGEQEILVNENIDNYAYKSFYYKANISNSEIIIKVSEGFNKILLPLSGSAVDVFLFGTYSLAAIFIILFSAIMANQISAPIRKLTLATKSIAAGDLSLELKTNAKGEMKELVSGFQYMVKEIKENQAMLAEIEREEAWKEMAKQVAHEIKNPLTPMKLSVQQLITAYEDKSDKFEMFFKKVTSTILNQIETLKNIANEFSNFARMPKLELEEIDLIEIVKQSINLFSGENVKIDFISKFEKIKINGDSQQLRRTIINLIRNSIQANSDKITFELSANEKEYQLNISDNGDGIKNENIEKIFDMNFTTKNDGMGLGLSLAKRYLNGSNADIQLIKTSEDGTTFQINFFK
ncbi:MAG: HAMP domain-containing protein [Ignavibacteriales bacterium]|nr:HAMP domain-containing protein [Ignavibacteriales bacterium]